MSNDLFGVLILAGFSLAIFAILAPDVALHLYKRKRFGWATVTLIVGAVGGGLMVFAMLSESTRDKWSLLLTGLAALAMVVLLAGSVITGRKWMTHRDKKAQPPDSNED